MIGANLSRDNSDPDNVRLGLLSLSEDGTTKPIEDNDKVCYPASSECPLPQERIVESCGFKCTVMRHIREVLSAQARNQVTRPELPKIMCILLEP
jgi:hypothetical protein